MGQSLSQKNIEYLDATLVGSSEHVRAGKAIALVGGTTAAFDRARPLLDCLATQVFHVGPWGSGARMKLVVNLVRGEGLTLRQLLARFAGARGHFTFAGTPEQVANLIEDWFRDGAADGFNVMPPLFPTMLDVFVEEVEL